jgi:hypothetical protein
MQLRNRGCCIVAGGFFKKRFIRLHFAMLQSILHQMTGNFCGKNPNNKSYSMPFIVKKCKLFHF